MLRLIVYPLIGLCAPHAITSFLPHLFKKKILLLRLAMLVMSFGLMGVAMGQATLVSDSADYQPGSTATLTGTGFQAGEQVKMQVLHADYQPGDPIGADHEPWYVTANSSGDFVTTWHVCEDDCRGELLRATAVGQSSNFIAEVLFYDATILVTGGGTIQWSTLDRDPAAGIQPPNSTDVIVVKEGTTLNVDVSNAECASIQLGDDAVNLKGSGTLTFNLGSQLTVSGTVQIGSNSSSNRIGTMTMTSGGTLICNGLAP